MPKHHTDLKALAELDDAVLATFAGPGRDCILCGDTGLAGYTPCPVCPAGRRLVAEFDATYGGPQ